MASAPADLCESAAQQAKLAQVLSAVASKKDAGATADKVSFKTCGTKVWSSRARSLAGAAPSARYVPPRCLGIEPVRGSPVALPCPPPPVPSRALTFRVAPSAPCPPMSPPTPPTHTARPLRPRVRAAGL